MSEKVRSVEEAYKFLMRGVVEVIPEDGLLKKLEESYRTGRPLKIKAGFDPTAPDLHLGHTVLINKLRQFQDLGHEVYFLIGDFTGMIGDPTGRSETRKALTREEVLKNAETYRRQVFKILDPEKTKIVFNSEWNEKLTPREFIELLAKFTVAQMLERDDFSKRFRENKPIFLHELLYPIIQGYDSVALRADVELGGTDQKFNLLVGRQLQKEFGQEPQVVMMMPLLVGLDGVQKMSKSYGNYVGIEEPPQEMFGKIMSISDELMITYYELLSNCSNEYLEKVKRGEIHPMEAKENLAFEIVERFHGREEAERARETFRKLFSKREIREEDLPEIVLPASRDEEWLPSILKEAGVINSTSEGKRLLQQGAVKINNEKITDPDFRLKREGKYIFRVGKKKFFLLRFE